MEVSIKATKEFCDIFVPACLRTNQESSRAEEYTRYIKTPTYWRDVKRFTKRLIKRNKR